MRRQPLRKRQRCPVCFASRPMIHVSGDAWRCKGCGASGFLLPGERFAELAVACSPAALDYAGTRGIRSRIVGQIRADIAKVLREKRHA